MKYKDYYQILGVARDASPEDIKRAYRKLARKYHPDVSKESNAEARFKEVNEANAVLGDPERRRAFDALGTQWHADQDFRPPPGGERGYRQQFHFEGGEDLGQFSDFFSSLFGGLGGRFNEGPRRKPQAQNRAPLRSTRISISLEEAFQGTTRQVRLELPGEAQGRTLNVRIPAGVTQGQRIRLSGQGQTEGLGAPRGDIYLEVDIQHHPLYELHGRNIQLALPIAPWEAALGSTVAVPTLSGKINLKIPEGSQSGRKLRLKGRGLPGDPPGDAYVVLEIRTPPATTEQARQFYRRMAQELPFDPRATLD